MRCCKQESHIALSVCAACFDGLSMDALHDVQNDRRVVAILDRQAAALVFLVLDDTREPAALLVCVSQNATKGGLVAAVIANRVAVRRDGYFLYEHACVELGVVDFARCLKLARRQKKKQLGCDRETDV